VRFEEGLAGRGLDVGTVLLDLLDALDVVVRVGVDLAGLFVLEAVAAQELVGAEGRSDLVREPLDFRVGELARGANVHSGVDAHCLFPLCR
jgi:hypothetical protein